jgi:hypothetical protein
MRPRSLIAASVLGLVASAGLVSSTASGDPGRGTTSYPVPPIDSTLDGPLRASADGIKLKITDDATVRNFILTYGPGAFSGCHEHPGIVLAVVLEGAVERRVPRRKPETFVVGDAFTEVGPHFVKNVNSAETGPSAKLLITQIVPKGTTTFREEHPERTCRPHKHS